MRSSDEAYISINKYINYSTGEEMLWYGKVYDTAGKARAYATRYRVHKQTFRSEISGMFEEFEYLETWCQRASEWERV